MAAHVLPDHTITPPVAADQSAGVTAVSEPTGLTSTYDATLINHSGLMSSLIATATNNLPGVPLDQAQIDEYIRAQRAKGASVSVAEKKPRTKQTARKSTGGKSPRRVVIDLTAESSDESEGSITYFENPADEDSGEGVPGTYYVQIKPSFIVLTFSRPTTPTSLVNLPILPPRHIRDRA